LLNLEPNKSVNLKLFLRGKSQFCVDQTGRYPTITAARRTPEELGQENIKKITDIN
jgi:hypothetical protein